VIYRIEVASTGPRVARGIVAAELSGHVRERKLDDLKLLVSELITHRVRQGRAGETITLDFIIWDTGDAQYDSSVLMDYLTWQPEEVPATPVTTPTPPPK